MRIQRHCLSVASLTLDSHDFSSFLRTQNILDPETARKIQIFLSVPLLTQKEQLLHLAHQCNICSTAFFRLHLRNKTDVCHFTWNFFPGQFCFFLTVLRKQQIDHAILIPAAIPKAKRKVSRPYSNARTVFPSTMLFIQ